ncbi:Hemicentin-1 [Desmophyllum pertusum]|uniref:Hemicentin-1 n=1 Tax=Desmophyllum pertusum TaxID=174260 RepID=A0A9X0D9P1_9CNID|nr:Hemicentin-1 [Desmophyllum pertusum]
MLTEIPENALRNLTQLMTLNLRSNRLRDFPATVFRDLVKLRSFNAGLNKLSTLPGRLFHGLNDLQELYLDNNAIESIPEELFQDLPSLKRLHLHYNKIKTFPGNAFRGTWSLQERAFVGLRTGIFTLLSGNPFYCDCKLRWLKAWLRSKAKYIHSSASSTTCSQPDNLKGKPILQVANEQFTCVDGQWTEWSPWNACSRTCGSGTQVSIRRCTNPPPGRGGEECKGKDIKTKSCNGPDCGASWTAWSEWNECSKTCSSGNEVRTRSCQHSLTGLSSNSCTGSPQETRICTRQPCSVDGVWSSWSRWSSCSVTCSWGTRVRARTCDSPQPQYGGKPCLKEVLQQRSVI